MAGIIGCNGLGVRGGDDSVIRVTQGEILETVDFPQAQGLSEGVSETVTVNVT